MRLFYFVLLSVCTCQLSMAQITMGSSNTPVSGALLQLKEDEGATNNAKRGLALPRVKLTSLTATGNNLATTVDVAVTSPAWDVNTHMGLVVYNTNKCDPFGKGLYIWNGLSWQGINTTTPILPPSQAIKQTTLHLPSGMDKRAMTSQTLSFNWFTPGTVTWSNLTQTTGGSYSGGLHFGGSITPSTAAHISPVSKN